MTTPCGEARIYVVRLDFINFIWQTDDIPALEQAAEKRRGLTAPTPFWLRAWVSKAPNQTRPESKPRLFKPPLAKARAVRGGDILLFVCLSVRSSVACEICEVIRYVAAPGGERGLIVSTPIHLFALMTLKHYIRWTSLNNFDKS